MIRRININKGLENTGESLELYKGLVQDFRKKYAAYADKIAGLVSEDNYKAAEIEAHSLKGVSNMLGFEYLNQLASKVEKVLREKDRAAFKRLIPSFKEAFNCLFEELDRSGLLEESKEEAPFLEYNEQNKGVLLEQLNQLFPMVREGKYQAEILVSELLSRYGTFGLKKELSELKAKIENLDFEEAEALIKTIKNRI